MNSGGVATSLSQRRVQNTGKKSCLASCSSFSGSPQSPAAQGPRGNCIFEPSQVTTPGPAHVGVRGWVFRVNRIVLLHRDSPITSSCPEIQYFAGSSKIAHQSIDLIPISDKSKKTEQTQHEVESIDQPVRAQEVIPYRVCSQPLNDHCDMIVQLQHLSSVLLLYLPLEKKLYQT